MTDYPLDVGSFKVSPRGDQLAVSMEVFPDCATLQCTRERLDGQGKNKATGRIYERLFIRHWDTPSNGTRSHLFTTALSAAGTAGVPLDVSRGFDADIPGKPFGDDADYAFSPDGRRAGVRGAHRRPERALVDELRSVRGPRPTPAPRP